MPVKSLDRLDPLIRPLVDAMLAKCREKDIDITVLETWRSLAQHHINLTNGTSRIERSKHCDGLAIDIAPTIVLKLKFWAPDHPQWAQLGNIGMSVGLKWGYALWGWDKAHFEI